MKFAKRPDPRSEEQKAANYRASYDKTKTCRLCKKCEIRFCNEFKKGISWNFRCDLAEFKSKRTGGPKK